MVVISASSAQAAMRLAQRTDLPRDIGPSLNPDRAAQGWRRYTWENDPVTASDLDKVTSKIKKLLSLAGNAAASEGEAANAAAAAQKLIEQYKLDVALLDEDEDAVPRVEEIGTAVLDGEPDQNGSTWRKQLALAVAEVNGAKVFTYGGQIQLVGTPSSVALIRPLYSYLVFCVESLAKREAQGNGKRYAISWRMGCVDRLRERLREAAKIGKESAKQEAVSKGADLVRVSSALARTEDEMLRVNQWMESNLRLKKSQSKYSVSSDAFGKGRLAGDSISLTGAKALRG